MDSFVAYLIHSDYVLPKMFDPLNLNDEKDYIPCTDIDPDSCCYNELSFYIPKNNNYYHADYFNHSLQQVRQTVIFFMHLPISAGGIMISCWPSVCPKPEIPSFHLYMGPLVHPTNRDRFAACPFVCPSVRRSVR